MPPRRGIVKSGNAGNSSKVTTTGPSAPPKAGASDAEKPLFPPGSKFPLSLLNERCQKNGWDKPKVDTRKRDEGWSFVVTLSRKVQKKGSGEEQESVRFEPHPPYICPTAIEARHWGATYALYRFCNGIQLNRVLPPGPREYWNELAAEHKKIEEHQKWMYEADPFAARRSVEERQAKAAKKKEEAQEASASGASGASTPRLPNDFARAPEVKMAMDLRTLVEDAIKKGIAQYPEAEDAASLILTENQTPALLKQLENLGFKPAQARSATAYLSQASPLTSELLRSSSPLEACIEYLVLHIPECDLPQRFLPENNSSNSFVTSAHSGTEDLKRRWMEDRAIKLAGWPAHVVHECTAEPRLVENWPLLVSALNKRLIGDDWREVLDEEPEDNVVEKMSEDEVEAIGASYTDDSTLVMPLFAAPLQVNFVIPPDFAYNRSTRPPPMYITSTAVPAYVRLHLLSHVLDAFKKGVIADSGNGICLGVMQVIDEQWGIVEDQGPPDISAVMRHLKPQDTSRITDNTVTEQITQDRSQRSRRGPGRRRHDPRTNTQIREDFEAICRNPKYDQLLSVRKRLPAFSAKEDFLTVLDKSRVVIVVGETGSGKTTQLPQFILDALIRSDKGSIANILVTQPRRISAISVAARVSAERLDDGSVGYTIRGESKQSEKTKLLFCTTGVVLRRLSTGDNLGDVSHVIVDEVHERSVDGDFLLLELKELLHKHPTLKVVLMSATINHETFVRYFNNAPLLTIPGITHPVTDKYLEDILPALDYRPQISRSGKRKDDDDRADKEQYISQGLDERMALALQAITRSDRLDYQLIAVAAKHIISTAEEKGGILIFLQGVQEIRQCIETLRSTLPGEGATIFPLHANLSSDEQRAVFAPTSKWKIVVATNVAETSITIDDITFVIDAGKVKETQYDPDSGLTKLAETWVTRAAARQRRGRAGRTRPGVCYKLYTRAQEQKMARFPKPEILRVPLENISLMVKSAREDEDVKAFLSRAIDPPDVKAIDKAWSVLEELGAIDEHGDLTALGRYLAMLPLDLRLGKLLVLGAVFQCMGPMLTIAAMLSSKPVFLNPMDKRDEATKARARFSTEKSDILTDMAAYDECMALRASGKPGSALRAFCEQNFISATTIRDITALRHDLLSSLLSTSLLPSNSTPSTPSLNTHSKHAGLLKALLLAALYPRVARIALPKGALKYDQVAAGTVQRANTAREWRAADMTGARVWVHPGSVLFHEAAWRSGVVVSFARSVSGAGAGKVFLRDVTEVPLYALLLFGGRIVINHVGGGLVVGGREGSMRLKAWPRIGILVQQLRRLLDAQLLRSVEGGTLSEFGKDNPVVNAMLALLAGDGLTGV
ncbi:P-loop containing nucleoside triphosphate hydrolase protein [Dentipellis sp. KUC8613]|nr:P-loop containing nucleoside triphosphate hydrolase protein [Dentipellis sp. KUC8613]